jgi:hypothetical protein
MQKHKKYEKKQENDTPKGQQPHSNSQKNIEKEEVLDNELESIIIRIINIEENM